MLSLKRNYYATKEDKYFCFENLADRNDACSRFGFAVCLSAQAYQHSPHIYVSHKDYKKKMTGMNEEEVAAAGGQKRIKDMNLTEISREITRVSDIIETTNSKALRTDMSKYRQRLFSEYRRKSHEYPSGHKDVE